MAERKLVLTKKKKTKKKKNSPPDLQNHSNHSYHSYHCCSYLCRSIALNHPDRNHTARLHFRTVCTKIHPKCDTIPNCCRNNTRNVRPSLTPCFSFWGMVENKHVASFFFLFFCDRKSLNRHTHAHALILSISWRAIRIYTYKSAAVFRSLFPYTCTQRNAMNATLIPMHLLRSYVHTASGLRWKSGADTGILEGGGVRHEN